MSADEVMGPAELVALARATKLIHELHAQCEELTARTGFLSRFTVVLAVSVDADDPRAMVVQTAGNGSPGLTARMLARALLQHDVLRKDVPL